MDRLTLSRIDEELESSEVAALCFLCLDVVNRKRLEGITDAKGLFLRLEERGLLENSVFLSKLLRTIRRADLLRILETDSRRPEETDASPVLSRYRMMLYEIYEDMTEENLEKAKFLLSSTFEGSRVGRRQLETSKTALDLFAEMEKIGLLSNTNLKNLLTVLQQFDQQLALIVQNYMKDEAQQNQTRPHVSMDYQMVNNNNLQPLQPILSISETQPSCEEEMSVCSDANPNREPSPPLNETEYYSLNRYPRGWCVVFNNENFLGKELRPRVGTQQDVEALSVFSSLGFQKVVHNNLTAGDMRLKLKELGKNNFLAHDALVVCVLSHGEKGCVFGTDEKPVSLRELTEPFTSRRAPTLAGKPKLFFIQACQGSGYQEGALPCPPRPREEEGSRQSPLEEDAGHVYSETVPEDADFLLGMATVQDCKSFRNTTTGSIYIQELCKQLQRSADSPEDDDILTVLTRVNREVSKGEFLNHKQMPEPKYTLTKRLVLKHFKK